MTRFESSREFLERTREDKIYANIEYIKSLKRYEKFKPEDDPVLTFIDFETANTTRDSICSVGISLQKKSGEIDSFYSLVRPEPLYVAPQCRAVHGIDYCHLKDAQPFELILPQISKFLKGIVICHNANFDMDCLSTYLYLNHLEFPDFKYLCTMELSKFISEDSSLEAMSKYFELPPFKHHNALDDARACGALYWKLREKLGAKFCGACLKRFKEREKIEERQSFYYVPIDEPEETKKDLPFQTPEKIEFENKRFIVTGSFANMPRKEIEEYIKSHGGKICSGASSKVDYIVIGEIASSGWANGNYGRKIEGALSFPNIVFISESEFEKHI